MVHRLQLNAWDLKGGGSKMEWVLNVDTGKTIFILPDIEYWEYSSIYKHKPTNSQRIDKRINVQHGSKPVFALHQPFHT